MYRNLSFFKSFGQTRSNAPLKVTPPWLKDAAQGNSDGSVSKKTGANQGVSGWNKEDNKDLVESQEVQGGWGVGGLERDRAGRE